MSQDQDAETVARQICDSCGLTTTDAEIKVRGFIACCPERKMRNMTFPERSLSTRLAAAEAENVRLGHELEKMVNVAAAGGYAGPTGWSFADREAELEKALTAIVRRLAAAANNAPNPEPITDPMADLVWIGNTAKDALDAIYQARAALHPAPRSIPRSSQTLPRSPSHEWRDEVTDHKTLGEALPAEMARVRDKVLPEYLKIPEGIFAATMMRNSLDAAAKAMAEGDLPAMIAAYEDLKGYSL